MRLKNRMGWIVTAFVCAYCLLPFAWLLRLSVTPLALTTHWPPRFFPEMVTFANFAEILGDGRFWVQLGNSVFVCVVATTVALFLGVLGAYGMARHDFKWKNAILIGFLALHLVPGAANMTAIYKASEIFHLFNSLLFVAILKAGGVTLAIWILLGTFKNVPEKLEQAAMLDGQSRTQALFSITIPLAGPGILTAGLLLFIQSWNTFLLPFLLLEKPEKMTLTVGLYRYFSEHGFAQEHVAAFLVLSIVPVLALFFVFRKSLWRNVAI